MRMTATNKTGFAADDPRGADTTALPRTVRALARLMPACDREGILGDLLEDAAFRHLTGPRRTVWLAGECGSIAAGLALDGSRALRGDHTGALLRGLIFCGSVATIVLGAEILVGSLMAAAGF